MKVTTDLAIRFEHDVVHDAYIVYPCCTIVTERDCVAWSEAYREAFEPAGRPVDCVVVLDMFVIAQPILEMWGRYRERLYEKYVRYCVRVDSNSSVVLGGMLSRRKLTRSLTAANVNDALALLQVMRARKL